MNNKIKKASRRTLEFLADYTVVIVAFEFGVAVGAIYYVNKNNMQWNRALQDYGIDLRDFHMIKSSPE